MESPPPPPPPIETVVSSAATPIAGDSNSTIDNHTTVINKRIKNKKKKKKVQKSHIDVASDPPQQSLNSVASSSSTSNISHSRTKGFCISVKRRNPRVLIGGDSRRGYGGEADALALPLGMSIAAFVAQVLEKKDTTGEKMSADHLSETALAGTFC